MIFHEILNKTGKWFCFLIKVLVFSGYALLHLYMDEMSASHKYLKLETKQLEKLKIIKLGLLNSELAQCISRANPDFHDSNIFIASNWVIAFFLFLLHKTKQG